MSSPSTPLGLAASYLSVLQSALQPRSQPAPASATPAAPPARAGEAATAPPAYSGRGRLVDILA